MISHEECLRRDMQREFLDPLETHNELHPIKLCIRDDAARTVHFSSSSSMIITERLLQSASARHNAMLNIGSLENVM